MQLKHRESPPRERPHYENSMGDAQAARRCGVCFRGCMVGWGVKIMGGNLPCA